MANVHISGAVLTESSRVPAGDQHFWVALRLDTGAAPERRVRVVLALDRSSSMRGDKLEAAKRAARTLVALMRDGDELGVVLFDGHVDVAQPVARVDAALRAALGARLTAVEAGHGTALADATDCALALARPDEGGTIVGEGHAIVLTDGFPYVGETDPQKIVERVSARARGTTLSTIAFGEELDGPLLASMAQAGLGRFLHLGEKDDAPAALAAELATASGAVTSRVQITVQLQNAVAIAYRGMREPVAPKPSVELTAPPLVAGESLLWPIAIQPASSLAVGSRELGLVTVRATRLDGTPFVLELPVRVEVGERLGEPNADVMRARCLFHAARVMRMVATDDVAPERLVRVLEDMAAHVYGQAVAVGLASDAPIRAAITMLQQAASLLRAVGEVPRAAASAHAASLEGHYDASVGTLVSPIVSLRTNTQRSGVQRATLIAPLIEHAPPAPKRPARPSMLAPPMPAPPQRASGPAEPVMPLWKVRIVYIEPTYAKHRGQPPQEHSGTFTVHASNEVIAEALARAEFQKAASRATVGWVREILRAEVERVH